MIFQCCGIIIFYKALIFVVIMVAATLSDPLNYKATVKHTNKCNART